MVDRMNTVVRNSFRARACDNCRTRKIKCDKAIPCSSCGALGIPCRVAGISTTSSSSASAPEPRRNESSQYEQRFEALQEQLAVINQTLAQITQAAAPGTTGSVSVPESSTHTTLPFEGQSSFHHETLLAKDAALSAISTSHNSGLNDHVSAVLSSLKNSLAEEHSSPNSHPTEMGLPSSSQTSEPLLPVDLVVAVVRAVKAKPPFFLVSHSWRDLLQVESLCQSIYFPVNPVPAGSLTLLYGLLYYIIRDYLHDGHPELARYDLSSSAKTCERRFYLGLNSYELMADPTIEKIQALLIGIIKAQEEFDIQRCWTYLSLAFNLCQTIGLHRNSTTKGDPSTLAETKRHAFWLLYTIDKNISLNLGFTSHFQDHDIDADLFAPSDHHQYRSWDLMTLVTAEFATIQGRVYDELYSISASRASDEKRLDAIEKLSLDLIAVRDKLLAIDVSAGLYADSLHGMAACADFITYSVLTVIYRAETRPRNAMAISSRCYEAATLALHSHLKCFTYFRGRQTHKQIEYVHWILLYPSFAPFVIVFTHAITTASNADLTLLQETVKSLDLIKGLSRGSRHLYTICEAFARAAQVLVESQQTLMGLEQLQDGSLVIPTTIDGPANISLPNVPWPEDTFDSTMSQEDISMFLNDFIGANRSVMDILNSNYMNDTLG
ncbi:C6 transcription factor [Aspergillus bertholletiae]|uniref:C6 transcription factor n=1 Tax=Aspergillus bertholletiae TaxID=1226010 RepID=A0A5N7B158_9EURO|nr:C6 transcription factor [Aspergillus bertholletiae]